MKTQTMPMENPVRTVIAEKPEICCCIGPGWNDPMEPHDTKQPVIKGDMRHFGRCQKIKFYFLRGLGPFPRHDRELMRYPDGRMPMIVADLTHAPLVGKLDVSNFDGQPGSIIRISSKELVEFVNVTVKIDDFAGHELVHEHAWLENDLEHWSFVYFPKHRYADDQGKLKVEIRASQEPRKPRVPWTDPYELSPADLTEAMVMAQ